MSLQILYRDEHLVAINKPAGLLVHRSWLDKGETQFAMQMTRDLIGQHVYTVHRLDRPTSGILLFALDPETARHLTDAFATHRMQKEYLALVRGWAPFNNFSIIRSRKSWIGSPINLLTRINRRNRPKPISAVSRASNCRLPYHRNTQVAVIV